MFGKKKEEVKEPKRCAKAIKIIHKWIDDLHYYSGNNKDFRKLYLNDAIFVENFTACFGAFLCHQLASGASPKAAFQVAVV